MSEEKKRIVKEEVRTANSIGLSDFDGPIGRIIEILQTMKTEAESSPLNYTDIFIDARQRYDDVTIELWGFREETDAEFQLRLKYEAKQKDKETKKQEEELALYKKLKAKYEK